MTHLRVIALLVLAAADLTVAAAETAAVDPEKYPCSVSPSIVGDSRDLAASITALDKYLTDESSAVLKVERGRIYELRDPIGEIVAFQLVLQPTWVVLVGRTASCAAKTRTEQNDVRSSIETFSAKLSTDPTLSAFKWRHKAL